MAKTKTRRRRVSSTELDSVYMLKLVLYLIVGSQWLWFRNAAGTRQIPIPVGLVLGLIFAMHDHFKIDRKIEYALLLVAMFVGFWTMAGIYITY
jgi:hypothetical protein